MLNPIRRLASPIALLLFLLPASQATAAEKNETVHTGTGLMLGIGNTFDGSDNSNYHYAGLRHYRLSVDRSGPNTVFENMDFLMSADLSSVNTEVLSGGTGRGRFSKGATLSNKDCDVYGELLGEMNMSLHARSRSNSFHGTTGVGAGYMCNVNAATSLFAGPIAGVRAGDSGDENLLGTVAGFKVVGALENKTYFTAEAKRAFSLSGNANLDEFRVAVDHRVIPQVGVGADLGLRAVNNQNGAAKGDPTTGVVPFFQIRAEAMY